QRSFVARIHSWLRARAALCVEPLRPCLLSVRGAADELAGLAIEHVVEGVAVGHRDKLARAAADRRVEEDRDLVRVPVVHVVRRELEVPRDPAVYGIQREQRTGVEVVAGADVAVPVGTWIAGAPVDEIERGVVGTGQPRRAAAVLPAVPAPAVEARFARTA